MPIAELESNEQLNAISQKMKGDYIAHRSEWMNLWQAQSLDTRLEAGDTSLTSELNSAMPNNFTAQWYFNMVRPRLNFIAGFQRRNRRSSIVVPSSGGNQKTADQWTKILMQLFKQEKIYGTISDSFHSGACVNGLTLMQVYLDFSNDPLNGEIKVGRRPYSSVIMDPYWKRLDLSDCSFVETRTYVRYEEACALLPEFTDVIMAMNPGAPGSRKSDKFTFMPENFGLSTQRMLAYDEYYYRTYRDQEGLYDKETGDFMEVSLADPDYIRHFLQIHPQLSLQKQRVPTVRMAIAVQDKIVMEGPQTLGIDRFPFAPIVGYFSPDITSTAYRFQSMARSLRDVQLLFNRRLITNSDIADSLVTSGVFYKEGVVLDESHLYQTGAGRHVPCDRNSNLQTDIMPRQPGNVSSDYFRLQDDYQNLFGTVTGITDTNMGTAKDDMPGITTRLKQGAGLTVLESLFDHLDESQENLTHIIMDTIRAYYTPGKIKTILGEEPTPFFYNKEFGKYHCQVQDGFDSESQKQLQFAQMFQLKQIDPNMFDTEDMLDAATLQNKTEMIEKSQKRQQAAQQQQQKLQESQQELMQAQIQDLYAKAASNMGWAHERESRIPENRAAAIDNLADAERQRESAMLDKVKMLKELEQIDLSHLQQLLSMAAAFKNQNLAEEAIKLQEVSVPQGNAMEATPTPNPMPNQ